MSTLHTINKTSSSDSFESCLRVAQKGDSILLIEDGVYQGARLAQHSMAQSLHLFALQEDACARGLSLPATITPIDYSRFVELVCEHQRSVSWF